MCSLANLSKFLGLYDRWKDIIRRYGLKWEQRNSFETFLSILNSDINGTKQWLIESLPKLPLKYRTALVYQALTGLRPNEACMSLRLLGELREQNRISEYYDSDLNMLEHFRYPQFLRGSKNTFISFIDEELLKKALRVKFTQTYNSIQSYLKKKRIPLKARNLRQLFATVLRNKGIPSETINLVQGRISKGVFVRFYYKPLLKQIGTEILQAIKPLQNELLHYL